MSLIGALLTVLVLQTAPPDNVNIWQGRNAEIEQCLAEAKVARLEDVPIGVTKPRRAMLEPGGCARAFAWKPLQPGYYSGFWESYKSEVAAYELDKALELNMVPVVVERKVNGLSGAADPLALRRPQLGTDPAASEACGLAAATRPDEDVRLPDRQRRSEQGQHAGRSGLEPLSDRPLARLRPRQAAAAAVDIPECRSRACGSACWRWTKPHSSSGSVNGSIGVRFRRSCSGGTR